MLAQRVGAADLPENVGTGWSGRYFRVSGCDGALNASPTRLRRGQDRGLRDEKGAGCREQVDTVRGREGVVNKESTHGFLGPDRVDHYYFLAQSLVFCW